MAKEKFTKSLTIIAIGVITPLFSWALLKSLANNSSSAHNPDPWIQGLVDQPQSFHKNESGTPWFQVISKEGELFWQKDETTLAPLNEIPNLPEKSIFLVSASGPKAAHLFYEFLKAREAAQKVLILSASDGFLKDMQFYDGNLLLSCGQAYLVRLRMLDQLGLGNLMKTNMSAVWLDESLFAGYKKEFLALFKARRVPVFINATETAISPLDANVLNK
ncbi:MAG: hypothetical protein IT287_06540 [Bdellovibrionaceae bacterium]|nr:hypothetical protein [Pseudobdellovibrionaceae bacterium]